MVLDRHRRTMDFVIVPLAHGLRRVNPNYVTLFGLALAFPAAYFFWRSNPATEALDLYLLWAAALTVFHGILDLVDGVIARTFHKETPLGDFLDHVADRLGDILLLLGLTFSPWGDLRVGVFAIVATLLSSYLGTQAQAVGAGRIYSGFLGRADRLVLLMVIPCVDHVLAATGHTLREWIPLGPEYALGWLLWYIAIGGAITSAERFTRVLVFLNKKAAV